MSARDGTRGASDDAAAWLMVLDAIAAVVGHRMNNPLATVAANVEHVAAEIARSRDSDLPARILARSLEQPVEDMGEAARQMRDFVNPIASTGSAEAAVELDVGELLDEAVAIVASEPGRPGRVTVHRGAERRIVGKPDALRRAFVNLLRSAPELVVEVRAWSADHLTVELRHPSGSTAPWSSRREGGPAADGGLSLLMALRLIRASGGSLAVDAAGEAVRVLLPTHTRPDPPPGRDMQRPTQPAHTPTRVLVVDDEALVARTVARTLGTEHQITVCRRAQEALDRIRSGETYDAIVCDLMMAEMTGMAFYEALVITAPALAERTLFMTGGAFTGAAKAFVETSTRPILAKPFSAADLRAAVKLLVAK